MPKVSFIVPCYNLGHLLRECVDSILMQTFDDFEVLIMDDCSPDNTPDVAGGFADARVIHIRNEVNLGHLRNYNKGIELARGEYVWQISADDRLRKPYILERYLNVVGKHPEVGYAICSGLALIDGRETEVTEYSVLSQHDEIFNGPAFLYELLRYNRVLVASCMVRKECFRTVSMFPLDLPFAGDWYLWCIFAVHYDVAYFAEPMVNYREHYDSMTNSFIRNNVRVLSEDDLAVRWRMKKKLENARCNSLVRYCKELIVQDYIRNLSDGYKESTCKMSWEEFELSLDTHTKDRRQQQQIREAVLVHFGDRAYWEHDLTEALRFYKLAMRGGPLGLGLWMKYIFIRAGRAGWRARQGIVKVREVVRGIGPHGQRFLSVSLHGALERVVRSISR